MRLNWLKLEDFRNYSSLFLDLKGISTLALVGENAQGKTNLLESIAFLALGKSFRSRKAMESLAWERPYGRVKAGIEYKGKEKELEIFFQRNPEIRVFKRNGGIVKAQEFLGTLRVVIFTPDHMQMLGGSPRLRRRFMDRVLVQLDSVYVDALSKYQIILKHRNALLKQIQAGRSDQWELDLWDARLTHEAERIWIARKDFMQSISKKLTSLYQSISKSKDELRVIYRPEMESFEERLLACFDSDLRSGSTSLGPHRDDFILELNGHSLSEFGSRGEARSGVLALKIAQIYYIEDRCKHKPLLLLDDVFSELDGCRQKQLCILLKDYQTVVTTTSIDHIKGLQDAKVILVKEAKLNPLLS